MIDKINESDIITLDDGTNLLIIDEINEFGGTYYLAVGIDDDTVNFDNIMYLEETIEDGDVFVEPVDNIVLFKKLGALSLTKLSIDNIPGLGEALLNELEKGN